MGKTTVYSTYKSPLTSLFPKLGIPSPFRTCTNPAYSISHSHDTLKMAITWLSHGLPCQAEVSTIKVSDVPLKTEKCLEVLHWLNIRQRMNIIPRRYLWIASNKG